MSNFLFRKMTDLFLRGEYGEPRRNIMGYFIEYARLLIQNKPPPLFAGRDGASTWGNVAPATLSPSSWGNTAPAPSLNEQILSLESVSVTQLELRSPLLFVEPHRSVFWGAKNFILVCELRDFSESKTKAHNRIFKSRIVPVAHS